MPGAACLLISCMNSISWQAAAVGPLPGCVASLRPEACQSLLLLLGLPFPLLGQGSCSRAIELNLLEKEKQNKRPTENAPALKT